MSVQYRFSNFCFIIFAATLSLAISVNANLDLRATFKEYAPIALFVAASFSYAALLKWAIFLVNNNSFLKRMYWGELYLDGFWYYTSFEGGKEFFGLWRITQDVMTTKIIAFGLDDNFRRRSTVQSVSDLIGSAGVYQVINVRWDATEGDRQQYAKTVLVPDKPVGPFLRKTSKYIRGETTLYGGNLDGLINLDLKMQRWMDVHSEDEAIAKIKRLRSSHN
jgi:hypothetical protein